jgi:hypothetical protein
MKVYSKDQINILSLRISFAMWEYGQDKGSCTIGDAIKYAENRFGCTIDTASPKEVWGHFEGCRKPHTAYIQTIGQTVPILVASGIDSIEALTRYLFNGETR